MLSSWKSSTVYIRVHETVPFPAHPLTPYGKQVFVNFKKC